VSLKLVRIGTWGRGVNFKRSEKPNKGTAVGPKIDGGWFKSIVALMRRDFQKGIGGGSWS